MLYILNTVVISQFSVQFLRGQTVILVNPGLGDKMVTNNTDNVLHSFSPTEEESTGRNNYPWSCDISGCLISNSDSSRQVYVIYGEHWLYDITQWYQRFILWYQGLDSDICGIKQWYTILFIINDINSEKKRLISLWYWTIQSQSITQVTQIPDFIKVWFAVIPFWY